MVVQDHWARGCGTLLHTSFMANVSMSNLKKDLTVKGRICCQELFSFIHPPTPYPYPFRPLTTHAYSSSPTFPAKTMCCLVMKTLQPPTLSYTEKYLPFVCAQYHGGWSLLYSPPRLKVGLGLRVNQSRFPVFLPMDCLRLRSGKRANSKLAKPKTSRFCVRCTHQVQNLTAGNRGSSDFLKVIKRE